MYEKHVALIEDFMSQIEILQVMQHCTIRLYEVTSRSKMNTVNM